MESKRASARCSRTSSNRSPFHNRDRHRLADARWRASLGKCYTTLSHVMDHQEKRTSKIQVLKKTKRHIQMLECTLQDLLRLKAERFGYHGRATLPRGFSFQDYLDEFLRTETFTICQNFSLNCSSDAIEMYKSILSRENQLHCLPPSIPPLPPSEPAKQFFSPLREILFSTTPTESGQQYTACNLEETRFPRSEEEEGVVPQLQQGPPSTPCTSRGVTYRQQTTCSSPRAKASRRKGHPRILGRTVRRRLLDQEENHPKNYLPNLETLVEYNEDQSLPDNGYILCSPFTRLLPAQEHRIEEEPERSFYCVEEAGFSCEDPMDTCGQSLVPSWHPQPLPTTTAPATASPRVKGRPLHIVWLNRAVNTRDNDQTVPVAAAEPRTPYRTLQEANTEPDFLSPSFHGDFDPGEGFNLSAYMNWCENMDPKEKHTESYTLWDSFHK